VNKIPVVKVIIDENGVMRFDPPVWPEIVVDECHKLPPGGWERTKRFLENYRSQKRACDCGAVKANTTHADWCSTRPVR
jgi:hypothetical protein